MLNFNLSFYYNYLFILKPWRHFKKNAGFFGNSRDKTKFFLSLNLFKKKKQQQKNWFFTPWKLLKAVFSQKSEFGKHVMVYLLDDSDFR